MRDYITHNSAGYSKQNVHTNTFSLPEAVSKYIIAQLMRKSQSFGEKWKIEGVYKTVENLFREIGGGFFMLDKVGWWWYNNSSN